MITTFRNLESSTSRTETDQTTLTTPRLLPHLTSPHFTPPFVKPSSPEQTNKQTNSPKIPCPQNYTTTISPKSDEFSMRQIKYTLKIKLKPHSALTTLPSPPASPEPNPQLFSQFRNSEQMGTKYSTTTTTTTTSPPNSPRKLFPSKS